LQLTKRNVENGMVKEDCIMEDATVNAVLHMWDKLIDKLQDSKSYSLENLNMKNYSGQHHIRNNGIMAITFEEVQTALKVEGPYPLQNTDKKVTVEELEFVNKLYIYLQCQIISCIKKIPYNLNANIITCPLWGATEKTKSSKQAMSARLCADADGSETWFTAFTNAPIKNIPN